jgi:hypothetical protein
MPPSDLGRAMDPPIAMKRRVFRSLEDFGYSDFRVELSVIACRHLTCAYLG